MEILDSLKLKLSNKLGPKKRFGLSGIARSAAGKLKQFALPRSLRILSDLAAKQNKAKR